MQIKTIFNTNILFWETQMFSEGQIITSLPVRRLVLRFMYSYNGKMESIEILDGFKIKTITPVITTFSEEAAVHFKLKLENSYDITTELIKYYHNNKNGIVCFH